MGKKRRKVRVDFHKNRGRRARNNDLTREVDATTADDFTAGTERISGKGDLNRKRTIIVEGEGDDARLEVDESVCVPGRVLSAIGLNSLVHLDDGRRLECTVRRVLRTLARDTRNVVVTGDRVLVRPANDEHDEQGVIERVEPRSSALSRRQNEREHIIAANVDQAAVIASANEPPLKPALIDRFVAACERESIRPLIVINKADLVPIDDLRAVAAIYARLAYAVAITSVPDRFGIDRLKRLLTDRTTVFSGQSGVGKSSLLNAVYPDYGLETSHVSGWTSKGRHTTRRAVLLPLPFGGDVIDTPGVRQFELWDVSSGEIEAYFAEFRPFVPSCRFPDCSHTHETECAVKRAVDEEMIPKVRYDSYVRILSGDDPPPR
ncbi:ribosome small subunit-dependent GTPase A [Stratiformator vulcanicus]|uniref:Small ribosomal subunit biogenesis GTPase RsgA n=1 Tax=Stratiformator vulcanicus TaxID=2527980 RepID=A0A517R433_9PLAN|nr:ribosome small subunit-dependent GTPase A [Stratiformator vulcanicus]QDT38655.1 Putative ribosome biogenesis GTPase RsgA [Stratiformator vulcanicus]